MAHRHINGESGTEDTQFLFWEYINGNFVSVTCELKAFFVLRSRLTWLFLTLPSKPILTSMEL